MQDRRRAEAATGPSAGAARPQKERPASGILTEARRSCGGDQRPRGRFHSDSGDYFSSGPSGGAACSGDPGPSTRATKQARTFLLKVPATTDNAACPAPATASRGEGRPQNYLRLVHEKRYHYFRKLKKIEIICSRCGEEESDSSLSDEIVDVVYESDKA